MGPVTVYTAGHVRAHLFLHMLAYDLEWRLRQKWAPMLFEDDDRAAARARRASPVEKAEVPDAARRQARRKITATGQTVHSLRTLLDDLATLTGNEDSLPGGPANPSPCSQDRHPCRTKPSSPSASNQQKVIPVKLQVDFFQSLRITQESCKISWQVPPNRGVL